MRSGQAAELDRLMKQQQKALDSGLWLFVAGDGLMRINVVPD